MIGNLISRRGRGGAEGVRGFQYSTPNFSAFFSNLFGGAVGLRSRASFGLLATGLVTMGQSLPKRARPQKRIAEKPISSIGAFGCNGS